MYLKSLKRFMRFRTLLKSSLTFYSSEDLLFLQLLLVNYQNRMRMFTISFCRQEVLFVVRRIGRKTSPIHTYSSLLGEKQRTNSSLFFGISTGNHSLCFKRMEQPLVLEFTQEGSLKDFVADNISYFHVPRKKPCAPRLNEVGDEATGRQSQYIFDTVPEVAQLQEGGKHFDIKSTWSRRLQGDG